MAITVKHNKVSTIPDTDDTSLVRPSDWNADHTLVGTIDVTNGGTGASTLTGYVKGNGTSAMTAVATVPSTDITGLGTMSTQNANAVAITGGTINGTTIGATTASTGAFTTATASTSFASPVFKATSSAGGALQNSGGTNQLQWGGGGGNNVSVDVAININPANAQVDISPTGTGTVRINPATAGTIDNTTIGATTPSTVNATTITGQTGVLRGTGQNFLLQSGWAGGTSGTVGSGAVAPTSWSFGSTGGTVTYASALSGSGNSIRFAATAARPFIQQAVSFVAGLTYSISFNVETVTSGSVTLANFSVLNGTTQNTTYFVDGTSVAGTTALTAGTKVQYVHNILTVTGSNFLRIGLGVNSTATGDVTVSNPQVEVGSTLNTYIPTTTTAVYGTPTLSFSGVSTIGLESNGALFVQPAGTGALQAQATTSTTAGGNARGANAVDWQTSRVTDAARVASGQFSVISGGSNNRSTAYSATTGGGEGVGAAASYAVASGGSANTASGSFSTVSGGRLNTSAGFFNFIGGGFTNSGTANAAVTTQSGTMNATTAVTLSGSNANIKVGQYITGTSIASDTYVAAISGTSLTLSQNASGSSTSTLSFFTPHGVVVGGGNNQATGSYSFIGGGGDAGTAANRNVASGDWSFVGGGWGNQATGIGAFVGGGGVNSSTAVNGNTASGISSVVGGGNINTASAQVSFVGSGAANTANAIGSSVLGGYRGTTRGIQGISVFPSSVAPLGANNGVSQSALLVLAIETTDATATALRSNTSAAGTTNQVILPNNSAYFFRGEVVSGVTSGGDTKGWTIEGVIKRGANAAATTLVGVTVTSMYADVGAATWTIAVTADTTNGGLRVTFTGQASTTIRTVCQIRTTEMTY